MPLQAGETLANTFCSSKSAIAGDLHLDDENWTDKKHSLVMGSKICFFFAVDEIGHSLGPKHSAESDSAKAPIYKHIISVEKKNEVSVYVIG